MAFWRKKLSSSRYSKFIKKIEKGNLEGIDQLLWQDDNRLVRYLPVTYDMLLKMRKPEEAIQGL